jgi:hypothetical protein
MKAIEKEFSQGVKILLERMQNNPEDFVGTDEPPHRTPKFSMFGDLMREIIRGDKVKHWDDWYLLTKEEQNALIQGYKGMMRSRFDQGIMKRLLDEPEEKVRFGKKDYNLGTPLTADQITQDALTILAKGLSNSIDKRVFEAAMQKHEVPKKFLLSSTQWDLANKLAKK